MTQFSKQDEFLLKEYDAAQQLTYHIDELRAKLTQFFLVFTGFATAALTLLVKGETATTVFAKPEGAVALLILVAALLGTTFVALIGRLRRAQIEHFRIVNNIRTHFLKEDYDLWNVVQLSAKTLPEPNRRSGSYFWILLIIVASSYLYLLTTYIHLTKVFGFSNYICAYALSAGAFGVALYLQDKLYFVSAKSPKERKYSAENQPS